MKITDKRAHDRRASVRRVHDPTKSQKLPIVAVSVMMADAVPDADNVSVIRAICSRVFNVLCARHTPEDPNDQLDSVIGNAAVLDTHGSIVMTNVAWQQSTLGNSPEPGWHTPQPGIGTNCLDVASRRINMYDGSDQAVGGICDVL